MIFHNRFTALQLFFFFFPLTSPLKKHTATLLDGRFSSGFSWKHVPQTFRQSAHEPFLVVFILVNKWTKTKEVNQQCPHTGTPTEGNMTATGLLLHPWGTHSESATLHNAQLCDIYTSFKVFLVLVQRKLPSFSPQTIHGMTSSHCA